MWLTLSNNFPDCQKSKVDSHSLSVGVTFTKSELTPQPGVVAGVVVFPAGPKLLPPQVRCVKEPLSVFTGPPTPFTPPPPVAICRLFDPVVTQLINPPANPVPNNPTAPPPVVNILSAMLLDPAGFVIAPPAPPVWRYNSPAPPEPPAAPA